MKMILIGQAPLRIGDPRNPLSGDPLASRLANLCGITKEDYLQRFERKNLLNYWPGKSGKGDDFPIREARTAAELLMPRMAGKTIVFIGIAVARAFGVKIRFLRWVDFNGGKAAILPHPSGINRWWNDEANGARVRRFMRRACTRGPTSIWRQLYKDPTPTGDL